MKAFNFDCGDKVKFQGKLVIENAIVCKHINTTDETMKVRVVIENRKIVDKAVGLLIRNGE